MLAFLALTRGLLVGSRRVHIIPSVQRQIRLIVTGIAEDAFERVATIAISRCSPSSVRFSDLGRDAGHE